MFEVGSSCAANILNYLDPASNTMRIIEKTDAPVVANCYTICVCVLCGRCRICAIVNKRSTNMPACVWNRRTNQHTTRAHRNSRMHPWAPPTTQRRRRATTIRSIDDDDDEQRRWCVDDIGNGWRWCRCRCRCRCRFTWTKAPRLSLFVVCACQRHITFHQNHTQSEPHPRNIQPTYTRRAADRGGQSNKWKARENG